MEEAISTHERLLIVPFLVSWQGQVGMNLPIPCLGIPRDIAKTYDREPNAINSLGIPIYEAYPIFMTKKSPPGLNLSEFSPINNELLKDCLLVSIDHRCTAYLWPPDADSSQLSLLNAKATWTGHGLITWEEPPEQPRVRDGIPVGPDAHSHLAAVLPDYDRSDPWTLFDLPMPRTLSQSRLPWMLYQSRSSPTEQAIRDLLEELEPITWPSDMLNFTLDDTDHWR